MGDKNRLQQVVWNLLSNAIKFTPKGGRIHIVTKRVNSHVEICVTDTGQGIAPEFLGQVFDRFQQADATTTRRYGGLGLGLSIVKHLAELHGGSVWAESEGVGLGATFIVSLRRKLRGRMTNRGQERRGTAVDKAIREPNLSGIRVLMVDDEPDSVAIVQRVLERRGAEVRAARSMDEAIKEFVRFAPQVVLSDIGMPEHDGYEFITRLRELPGPERAGGGFDCPCPDRRSYPRLARGLSTLCRQAGRFRRTRGSGAQPMFAAEIGYLRVRGFRPINV
jgi:CheY-like chemotaxis protein